MTDPVPQPVEGTLTLAAARTIVAGALGAARDAGYKPLAVLVLDAGGAPLAFEREDGASPGRYAIANGKAAGAIAFGVGSRTINEWAAERPAFVAAAGQALGGALVPVPGGVLVRDHAGRVLGAVGVTGDTSDHDEAAAVAGIDAAGLVPDAG